MTYFNDPYEEKHPEGERIFLLEELNKRVAKLDGWHHLGFPATPPWQRIDGASTFGCYTEDFKYATCWHCAGRLLNSIAHMEGHWGFQITYYPTTQTWSCSIMNRSYDQGVPDKFYNGVGETGPEAIVGAVLKWAEGEKFHGPF